jgi:hypothetical protein
MISFNFIAKRERSKIDILRFYEKICTVHPRIGMNDFFAELKRRNVYKVAVAYIVAGWALSQGMAQVLPVFDVPIWVIRFIVLLIIMGLPIALVLASMFELTPHGIKRTADVNLAEEPSRSDARVYVVVIGALVSIGLFFAGRYTAGTKTAHGTRFAEGTSR